MGRVSFSEEAWDTVSPQAKDLLKRMLVVEPKQRYSIDQCL